MASIREVKESPREQGADERIAYEITTTPWGSTPSAVDVKLFSIGADGSLTDVTATKLSGVASVTGDVITTPLVISLVAGTTYRLETKFTTSGNVLECFMIITGTI